MATWSKAFLLEFIHLFKSQEPLWSLKCVDYYNRKKRNACYDVLLEKILTIDPHATRETAKKKIDNLRGAFRKEYNKVKSSMGSDEIHTPKLWYYGELLFLKDQEEPAPSTSVYVETLVESSLETDHFKHGSTTSLESPRPESLMKTATWSKSFLLEFIQLFKSQEPLWLVTSKDYNNRKKRNACYDILLEKVLTIDPYANRCTVRNKINNLRGAFRKEYNKVDASMGSDEIHTPKLWYYGELLFLKDQEEASPSTCVYVETFAESASETEDFIQESIASPESPRPESSLSSNSRIFKRKHPSSNKSSTINIESQSILQMLGDRLSSLPQDDECDLIGKNIALKLRSLNSLQKIYAEKVINDTLFEAQLNHLSKHSRLSNPDNNKDIN